MTDSYIGSSCRGSIRSSDFQSSNNSAASPVSARNALLSASSINAIVTDRELFVTAASVIPKLRSVMEYRKDTSRSSIRRMTSSISQQAPLWVVKKQQHGAVISEFDRAKLPSAKSDAPTWFRGNTRFTDVRHSMVEPRGSIYTGDGFRGEHTQSEVRARELLQWPRNDSSVIYAVSAQVTLTCRLDEAMTMLFSRDSLQFDASMGALFGARKYKSGDLLVSREFRKNLHTVMAMDHSSCWEDDDLNDLSQSGWVALQSVVLCSRRSLNLIAAARNTSRRQRLCFAAYSQYCPDTNEAFYSMRTLPKPMHDKFTRHRNERATNQAIQGDMEHISAGYHLASSYSSLSGHQTRIVMTAYVTSPPVPVSNVHQGRSRFWGKEPSGSSRHYAQSANAEAKYVVNLLAAATTSFEQLVRRRRLGYQPMLHMPVNNQDDRCTVCLKAFGLLRSQRFCQLCANRVCRECSRKFAVEPVARKVRRNRICFACVAHVDASVFQQDDPLPHSSFHRVSTAATATTTDTRQVEDAANTKISTAFYDILLKSDDTVRFSQSTDARTAPQVAYDAQMHRLDRSSSAATTSASFSSTPGRQLADALFSSDPLTRARALEIVRQVVKQVTSNSAPTSSTSTSSSTSASSIPVFHSQYPDKKMVDKYLEARLHLSSISKSSDLNRETSAYNRQDMTQRRRRSTSGKCFPSSANPNTRPSIVPRPWTTTNMEVELDLDDDLDSVALDSICEVAAGRMRCSTAYIVAFNGSHTFHSQRVVGSSGAPRPLTDEATVCPFSLVANGKPFVVKDPMRDPQLRQLRLVRDINVRFFAGFPIKSPDGSVVACLCTLDVKTRDKISLEDLRAMHALSKLASDLFEEEVNPYTPRYNYSAPHELKTMRMRLLTRLTRAPVRSKAAPTTAVQPTPVPKPKETSYSNGTGWVGFVTTATALSVVYLMHRDAPSSDVECGSNDGSWWKNAKIDQRGHYALLKELGRGGFSIVRLAVDMKTDKMLAAKIFDPKCASTEAIQAEIDILRHLGTQQNIVSLHDVLYLKNETIMLTDLVEGGELFDYIVDMGSVSEQDAAHLLHDVCQGLAYVHSRGVCHRDIKPENVLLSDRSAKANVKVADFGLSRRQRQEEQIIEKFPNGTVAYWAPEIITRHPQDFSVDMWAFGVLAYITLTGVHPFDPRGDKSDAEIVKEIANGSYDEENKWYKSLSADAKNFLMQLLDSDPSKRLTATQAMLHPWLSGLKTSAEPFDSGHTQRLQSYQRLQQLRANILAVVMGVQHAKLGKDSVANERRLTSHRTSTVNMDMFKETFALFDKDESGCIDRKELKDMLLALGQQLSNSEIDEIMRQADVDGDGKISFTEFVSMMNQRLFRRGDLTTGDLKAAFDTFDVNHDGFITSVELEHILHVLGNKHISNEETCKIIQAADKNEDGKIDYEEFCALMQQQTHVGDGTAVSEDD